MNVFSRNGKYKLALLLFGIVILVSNPITLLAQTSTVIQVGDGAVDAGESVSIPLSITLDPELLSAITLKLFYDPLVLQATDCETVEFIGACNISVAGEISATAVSPAGVNGTFVLLNIRFSAIDTMSLSDTVTDITINEVSTFAGPTGEGIEEYALDNGELLIRTTLRQTPSATPIPTEPPTQVPPTQVSTTSTPLPTTEPTQATTDTPTPTAEPTQVTTATPLPTAEPTLLTTNTPTPTSTPRPTATETDGLQELSYQSSSSGGATVGFEYSDEDILVAYPDGSWLPLFDISDASDGTDIDAIFSLDDGSFLLSFNASTTINGLKIDDSDIVRFTPSFAGGKTSGTFKLYLDGSDVGLTEDDEDINALHQLANGELIISTIAETDVTGVVTRGADLLRFSPTALGEDSAGTWALYFDGSDVGLNNNAGVNNGDEDIWGVSINEATGDIYLTTRGDFIVTGANGDSSDILVCSPASLGVATTCQMSLYWDGSANGFGGENIDALHVGSSAAIDALAARFSDVSGADSSMESDALDEDPFDTGKGSDILLFLPLVNQ